ncbi:trigger factor-like [Saccostrea echinata]|uniref:trigger factor-like n=1 Tax=Saccostrea echinata TaxID=191078 RepID=UPI002A7FE84B|nr:trigger factor-like [Saccostrea echinata]
MASGRAFVACRRVSSLFRKTSLYNSFSVKCNPSLLQILSVSPSYQLQCGISTTDQQQTNEEDDLYSKIMVEVKGHERKVLDSYYWYLKQTAFHLDLGPHDTYVQRKPTFDKLTLNKSVHIFKKHRVQYEARTHVRTFIYYNLTGSTARTFLEYIQRNLPEGVAMKITKFKMERLPEHLQKDAVIKLEEMAEAVNLPIEKSTHKEKVPISHVLNPKIHRGGIPNHLLSTILMKKQDLPDVAQEHAKVTVAKKEHLEVEPAREKHTKVQASELENREIIQSVPEHKEVISSEPEHKEVISSEPEHKEVISSEPEHKEMISSEPEHKEVISSEPEHKEMVKSEPDRKEMVSSKSEPENVQSVKKGQTELREVQESTGMSDSSVKKAEAEKEPSSSDSESSDDSDSSDSDSDDNDSDDKKGDESDEGLSDNQGSLSEESKDEKDPNKK